MPVNWNLFVPPDISGKFDEGWQRGRAQRNERDLKSALRAYSENPASPAAQSALARVSPEFAMKMAESQWKRQEDERKRQAASAFFDQGPGGVPAGVNGQPKINWRARQAAAAQSGADMQVITALGAMADDQERAEKSAADLLSKQQTVEIRQNPVSGNTTYHDWQGNPIGTDTARYVRDERGIPHQSGWTPPSPAPPAAQASSAMTPSGDPLSPAPGIDPRIAVAPKAKILSDALAVINMGVTPEQEAMIWAEAAKHGVYPPGTGTGAPQ